MNRNRSGSTVVLPDLQNSSKIFVSGIDNLGLCGIINFVPRDMRV